MRPPHNATRPLAPFFGLYAMSATRLVSFMGHLLECWSAGRVGVGCWLVGLRTYRVHELWAWDSHMAYMG